MTEAQIVSTLYKLWDLWKSYLNYLDITSSLIKWNSCHTCTMKLWWVLNGRIQSFCNRSWHHSTSCTHPSNHSPKPVDFTPWISPRFIQFSLSSLAIFISDFPSISCLKYFNHMGHLPLPILPPSCRVHTPQSILVWENSSMAPSPFMEVSPFLPKGAKPFVIPLVLYLASLLAPLPLLSELQQCLITETPQT